MTLYHTHIINRLSPGATLLEARTLRGGVSACVEVLTYRLPSGEVRRAVARRHGAATWKPQEQGVTSLEFNLLRALHARGVSVPEPFFADPAEGYLTMAFVEGTTEVSADALPSALDQLAAFLAALHAQPLDGITLPAREDPVAGIRAYLPRVPDNDTLRTFLLGYALEERNGRALLHGDYWPGNVLWRRGRLVAVIDWEDAAIGDPLADLAGSRVELLWRHGPDVMEAFTARYLALRPLDTAELPVWDLFVVTAGTAHMGAWGLEAAVEAEMRSRSAWMLRRASRRLLRGR